MPLIHPGRSGKMGGFTSKPQDVLRVELLQQVSVEAPGLDGEVVEVALLVAFVQNVLLDCFLADQPVDVHLPRLANPMAPVLRLQYQTEWFVSLTHTDAGLRPIFIQIFNT